MIQLMVQLYVNCQGLISETKQTEYVPLNGKYLNGIAYAKFLNRDQREFCFRCSSIPWILMIGLDIVKLIWFTVNLVVCAKRFFPNNFG